MKKINKDQMKRIESRITETLQRYFANITIIDTHVTQDFDRDGDEILLVSVVFEGNLKKADARLVAGAARRIRPVLKDNNADLFPLLSFVSKVDWDHGRRAGH